MLVFYLVLVTVRLVRPCSMNVGILFGLVRSLVRLVQACSCMLVFYSVLVRQCSHVLFFLVFYLVLVQPCSMYILVFFFWGGGGISTLVQMVRPYSFMLVFYLVFSTLIRLVRPCSMYHISLNNNRGDYLLFRIKRGRLFEGGDYFKYCSLEVVP